MKEVIESILNNTKKAYKESVVIDNEKLQDLLLTVLTETKKLEDISTNLKENTVSTQPKENVSTRYSVEQVREITKIQLDLAKEKIPLEVAQREITKIASSFPIHNLKQYNKRLKEYLQGVGSYGFAFPSNWAKALLEETNNNNLVIQAFRRQQDLYLKKDGRINEKLETILNSI